MAVVKPSPRPNELIDALDNEDRRAYAGRIWRAVRIGHDVLRASRAGGRWDDGTFDVIYTSELKDGAIAERHFHLSQGQPLIPSKPKYVVYELQVSLTSVLDLSSMDRLTALGVNTQRYGALSYLERHQEYPTTQQIAEIAHFLDFDGILVPNARWDCKNLIILSEHVDPSNYTATGKLEPIDWDRWQISIKKR